MKIRNRLVIAFIISAIFPLIITLVCIKFFTHQQQEFCLENYNISSEDFDNINFLVDPLQFLNEVISEEYDILKSTAEETPDQFLDHTYVEKFDKKLQEKNSCLILLKDEKTLYKSPAAEDLAVPPAMPHLAEAGSSLTFLDDTGTILMKETSFLFGDSTLGQFLLVSNYAEMHDKQISSVRNISAALCILLLATNALLYAWIYQGIVRPLNILRIATSQIISGNLGEAIQVSGRDEIGELCTDFDNMRIRLKSIINKQIHTETKMLEILSNLSHDLKTPITAIKGYTEGILDGVADTYDKQQRYLQTIYAKTNDISYLLDELSIYSKIEQNVMAYNFIPVNLEEFFNDCIDYFKLDLERNNISIDYYNSTDFSTKVLMDSKQLRRAIQNLIDNAVKYNDKADGHIYIRIENIPEKTSRPLLRYINESGTGIYPRSISESFVRIEIEDNGAGIPANDLPHIFDRFYRADASRNPSRRGSGLGLSIVKMIIYDHGGEVGADSIEGTGSRFYFTLRKVSPPPPRKNKESGHN